MIEDLWFRIDHMWTLMRTATLYQFVSSLAAYPKLILRLWFYKTKRSIIQPSLNCVLFVSFPSQDAKFAFMVGFSLSKRNGIAGAVST